MKSVTKQLRQTLTVALMLGLLVPAATAFAGSDGKNSLIAPPNSHAYGNTLPRWLTLYWQWAQGGDPSQSRIGDVQLMPLPTGEYVRGDITNPDDPAYFLGELAITIPAGTPIVLPVFSVLFEMYQDGTSDTPYQDNQLLASVHPALIIDGVVVLTDANKADYYVPQTYFDAPIYYPEPSPYGSVAVVFFQGAGVVVKPLAPGQHTIHLLEPWVFPPYWSLVFDNTWHITVTR
jgi:hypothetical protein